MTITSIRANDPSVANRYLADQLTQGEREEFEARLVDDPAVLRELEATARFKRGLRKLRAQGRLDGLVEEPRSRHRWWMTAAAAVAVLALGIGVLRFGESAAPILALTPSSLIDHSGNALAIGATYPLFRSRGARHDAVIPLPASPQAIQLRVLPDAGTQPTAYRLSLVSVSSAQEVASVPSVPPGTDGSLSVYVDSSRIVPGEYKLVVSSDLESAQPETFLISFRSGPSGPES